MSVTGTVCGEFAAPEAVIVIVAVYVLSDRPAVSTDKAMLSVSPVDEPLIGFNDHQRVSSVTLQFNVPSPEL